MCAQQCFLIFLVAFSHDMHLTGHRMPLRPQVSAGEHEEALQVLGEAGFIGFKTWQLWLRNHR